MKYMKKFFGFFLLCGLLALTPCAQAQKWQGIKKLFSKPKAKVSVSAVTNRVKEAVFRAWAKTRSVPYIAQVVIGGEVHHYASLSSLLPKGNEVSPHVPSFPLPSKRKEMYRGMMLGADGKDLLYILKNGLEASKSHYYEDGMSYDGKTYPSGTKAIYVATELEIASQYVAGPVRSSTPYLPVIFHSPYLPVIFHFKSVETTRDVVYTIPHDIPPSWIYRVSALLKIDGRLTWGELKVKDDTFVFIPYPPAKPGNK